MNRDILVFAEQRDLTIEKISYELIRGAKELAACTGGRVLALLMGFGLEDTARKLSQSGANEVIVIDHPALSDYLAQPYVIAMSEAVRSLNPSIVLFGSTTIGMELAPGVAASLDTGLVTDCTELSIDPKTGLLHMTRPNVDGIRIDTFVCNASRPQMATVRPGVLGERQSSNEIPCEAEAPCGSIRRLNVNIPSSACTVKIESSTKGTEPNDDITQARILVAGGRGVGPDGALLLRSIAGLLGGTIACSRACVESGWIDTAYQVGQTGKTVRPDLYLACGISGAFQHVTGMEGSGLIISINKNPSAPIFDISDLGIVGNVEVVLPRLIEALMEYRNLHI